MNLRQYLRLMGLATIICWSAWGFIVFTTDPTVADAWGLLLFYAGLMLALVGTFSLVIFFLKRFVLKNDEVVFRHVRRTFRQSIVAAGFVLTNLLLLQKNLWSWWNFSLLILLIFVLEGIVFTSRKFNNQDYVR